MSLEALGVPYAALKNPEWWAVVVVAIATIAAVVWDSCETIQGHDRPVLRVIVGIMFSFLAVVSLVRAIGYFRLGRSNYRWVSEVLMGLTSLAVSIVYIKQRNARTRPRSPRSFFEWLYEHDKPPMLFNKKDD
jgi:hypothetical protein